MTDLRRRLEQLIERLSPRERLLVGAGVAAGLVVLVWLLGAMLAERRSTLTVQIAASERELAEIAALRDRYVSLRADNEQIRRALGKSGADFSLFSHLEGIAREAVSRERIAAMNPSSRSINDELQADDVDMRLSGVSLRELVTLLYGVEKGEAPLLVSRLQMKKRFDQPYLFDVSLMVSRLRPTAAAPR
jgi:hypothetical protein